MEQKLKELYEAWLTKHKAPDEHPHRELYDLLVGAISTAEARLAKLEAYFETPVMVVESSFSQLEARLAKLEAQLTAANDNAAAARTMGHL